MSPYREPTLTPPRMRWVLTRSLWPELATAMLVLAVSIRVWLLAPTFFGACWVALVAAMVVLAAPRFVARVPVENGTPWRRSVVHVVCPWRQSAREWAGGRWALTQRSDTVRWQNTVWTSGEWTAVDACPHADRSKRPYGMEPEEWVPCDCEVYP